MLDKKSKTVIVADRMEELIELLCIAALCIATVVFYATWYGLIFLGLACMAVFSGKYRQKLWERWNCSGWQKFLMLLGTSFYLGAFLWAGNFWWGITFAEPVATETVPHLPLTKDETSRILKTKTIPELVNSLDKIKQRLADEAAQK